MNQFYVSFDGTNWICWQDGQLDDNGNLIVPLTNAIYNATWDGTAVNVTTTLGTFPVNGIPFMGWPVTDVAPPTDETLP